MHTNTKLPNISSNLFKVNLFNNKKKWTFFNKIYFLRKHGTYETFYYTLEKSLNNNIYFFGIDPTILNNNYINIFNDTQDSYIFNYFDNFYKTSITLRYHFKLMFLKKSKKHTKIRTFLLSKKIHYHPCIMHVNDFFFSYNYYPGYVLYKRISIILKMWLVYNQFFYNSLSAVFKKIFKKTYFMRAWRWSLFLNLNYYENDITAGFYIKLSYYEYNCHNSFWSILIKFLYWRLYSM